MVFWPLVPVIVTAPLPVPMMLEPGMYTPKLPFPVLFPPPPVPVMLTVPLPVMDELVSTDTPQLLPKLPVLGEPMPVRLMLPPVRLA